MLPPGNDTTCFKAVEASLELPEPRLRLLSIDDMMPPPPPLLPPLPPPPLLTAGAGGISTAWHVPEMGRR